MINHMVEGTRGLITCVSGRSAHHWAQSSPALECFGVGDPHSGSCRLHNQLEEVRPYPYSGLGLLRGQVAHGLGTSVPANRPAECFNKCGQIVQPRRQVPHSPCLAAGAGTDGGHHLYSPFRPPTHAFSSIPFHEALGFLVAERVDHDHQRSLSESTMVVSGGESVSRITLFSPYAHHGDRDGRLQRGMGRSPVVGRPQPVVQWPLATFRTQALSHQSPGATGYQVDYPPCRHSCPRTDSQSRVRQHDGSQLSERAGWHEIKTLCDEACTIHEWLILHDVIV